MEKQTSPPRSWINMCYQLWMFTHLSKTVPFSRVKSNSIKIAWWYAFFRVQIFLPNSIASKNPRLFLFRKTAAVWSYARLFSVCTAPNSAILIGFTFIGLASGRYYSSTRNAIRTFCACLSKSTKKWTANICNLNALWCVDLVVNVDHIFNGTAFAFTKQKQQLTDEFSIKQLSPDAKVLSAFLSPF